MANKHDAESGAAVAGAAHCSEAWTRGYYAAVAALIQSQGMSPVARELFRDGGNPEIADDDDKQVFRAAGLLPNNELTHGGKHI